MIIKFLKAFFKASYKERIEFFQYVFKKTKQRFVEYWFGWVSVTRHYINDYETGKSWLDDISFMVGKHGKGQCFDNIDPAMITKIFEATKDMLGKYFNLRVDIGCGAFQEYLFDKYQVKLLRKELEKIFAEEELYINEEE